MADLQFTLTSGRRIGISSWGEPASRRIVVFCHPTPGAGQFDPDPPITSRSGLRIVAVDRPGYGGSDPLPEGEAPTVERFADDIAEYLLGSIYTPDSPAGTEFPPVSVVGWSFGGTVALSFAARYPHLVGRVDAVATLRPSRTRRGERYSPVTELRKKGVERHRSSLANTLDEEPPPDFESLGIPLDDRGLDGWGLPNRLSNMLSASYEQGAAGVASDRFAALDTSWTDQLDNLACPCVLSYGVNDPIAGEKDALWYQRRVATARVEWFEEATHSAIAPAWGLLLSDIRSQFEEHEH